MSAPYALPQSDLMARLGLTSGTVGVRLGRLEAKGVVTRRPSSDDGRGCWSPSPLPAPRCHRRAHPPRPAGVALAAAPTNLHDTG